MKMTTIKQEKEVLSLTFLSTWLKRDKKILMPGIMISITRALSRTSPMKFNHICQKALLKMWIIIMHNITKAHINKTSRATTKHHINIMIIKRHINNIKSLINNMKTKMVITMMVNITKTNNEVKYYNCLILIER